MADRLYEPFWRMRNGRLCSRPELLGRIFRDNPQRRPSLPTRNDIGEVKSLDFSSNGGKIQPNGLYLLMPSLEIKTPVSEVFFTEASSDEPICK